MPRRKSWRARDPEYQSEAAKYEHPIPSRTFLLEVLEDNDAPMGLDDLMDAVSLQGGRDRDALRTRLRAIRDEARQDAARRELDELRRQLRPSVAAGSSPPRVPTESEPEGVPVAAG